MKSFSIRSIAASLQIMQFASAVILCPVEFELAIVRACFSSFKPSSIVSELARFEL